MKLEVWHCYICHWVSWCCVLCSKAFRVSSKFPAHTIIQIQIWKHCLFCRHRMLWEIYSKVLSEALSEVYNVKSIFVVIYHNLYLLYWSSALMFLLHVNYLSVKMFLMTYIHQKFLYSVLRISVNISSPSILSKWMRVRTGKLQVLLWFY